MVGNAKRFLLILAMLAATASGVVAQSPHTAKKSPASIGATLFRDIARHQNPAVVSIMARSRGRPWGPEEEDVFRLFGVAPPDPADHVQRILGSGFVISATGEILTNSHDGDAAT